MKDFLGGIAGALQGKLREQFGSLSEEDLAQATSNPQAFVAKVREKYGGSRDEIAQRLSSLGLRVPGTEGSAPQAAASEESAPEVSAPDEPA